MLMVRSSWRASASGGRAAARRRSCHALSGWHEAAVRQLRHGAARAQALRRRAPLCFCVRVVLALIFFVQEQRASIAQGKGFLAAVTAAFADLTVLAKQIKSLPNLNGHLAPLFGIFSRSVRPHCPASSSADGYQFHSTPLRSVHVTKNP